MDQLKEYHILIAEDNGINRFIFVKMLQVLGKPITEAEDGREVLQALETLKDHDTILLLDLNMPVLDGYSVIRKMAENKEVYQKVKIVVISGTFFNDFSKTGLEKHISSYLEKPIDEEDLIRHMKKCAAEF